MEPLEPNQKTDLPTNSAPAGTSDASAHESASVDISSEDVTSDSLDSEDEERGFSGYVRDGLYFIWETFRVLIISLIIIIPVRYFLVQPFFVKGASMENTFHDGEYILIDEISYRFRDPVRGDITVFRFPQDQSQFFIKRVVGLPGETIQVKNNTVTVFSESYPNGVVLKEPYLSEQQVTLGDVRLALGENEYFVMGDNRLRSSDSRSWGVLPREMITGRVFFRAWPFNKFGAFKDPQYEIK